MCLALPHTHTHTHTQETLTDEWVREVEAAGAQQGLSAKSMWTRDLVCVCGCVCSHQYECVCQCPLLLNTHTHTHTPQVSLRAWSREDDLDAWMPQMLRRHMGTGACVCVCERERERESALYHIIYAVCACGVLSSLHACVCVCAGGSPEDERDIELMVAQTNVCAIDYVLQYEADVRAVYHAHYFPQGCGEDALVDYFSRVYAVGKGGWRSTLDKARESVSHASI
jgi:hypothetical protein